MVVMLHQPSALSFTSIFYTLYKQLATTITHFEGLSSESTFGWDLDINFPKALANVIESLVGTVFIDSGYNKGCSEEHSASFGVHCNPSETLKLHYVRELHDIRQKHHHHIGKSVRDLVNGVPSITLEVEANGSIFRGIPHGQGQNFVADKIASRAILKVSKESIPLYTIYL